MSSSLVRSSLSLALLATPVVAQGPGSYLNFESPQLDPIVVTDTGTNPWLLVCNTPDNSVEVYSLSSGTVPPPFVARVPTGLEPVTVAVKPTLLANNVRRCYVAGWLSDSITVFDLAPSGIATLVRTVRVGDEPVGLAFHPEDESLIVTFSAQGAWGWFDEMTFAPMGTGYERLELLANGDDPRAIEDPRAVAFSPSTAQSPNLADEMFVLNFRGGSDASKFDFDLWAGPVFSTTTRPDTAGLPDLSSGTDALGSTNFNMAFAPNGDLYVVSQHARNKDLDMSFVTDEGGPMMRRLVTSSTGFVTSQLVRVKGAGTSSPVVERIDLNATNPSQHQQAQDPMPITQPTDVAVKGSGADNATRVFVTGFNSDTIGMIRPTGTSSWTVTRIDVSHPTNPFPSATATGIMRGPRGLALNAAQTRVYVMNRLENSVTVLDADFNTSTPASAVLGTFALQSHPVPSRILDGRKILYSSRLSGGGNVSCASCHIDGNSDFLAWNLADGHAVDPSPNPFAGVGGDPLGFLGPNSFLEPGSVQNVKGPLQTQSLRGLVNFEISDPAHQDRYFSNAPYHWRGDRGLFVDFNEAFLNLMAIPDLFDPNPAEGNGIPDEAMERFRDFVSTIHYPPNPDQPITRVYSGSMTTPANNAPIPLEAPIAGSGAQRGFKNMHIENSDGNSMGAKRGCITCHSLPEGSNNRLTDLFAYFGEPLDKQRMETTALRRLDLKERELWRFDATAGAFRPIQVAGRNVTTGEFGLTHTGDNTLTGDVFPATQATPEFLADSIKSFLLGFPPVVSEDDYVAILREFDAGVAPVIGQVVTVTAASNVTAVNAALDVMEGEARKGNAGIAVALRLNTAYHGFWYDVRNFAGTPYTEEVNGTPLGSKSRSDLIALAQGIRNVAVFQSVPLGSARRVARPQGGLPAPLGGSAPSNLVLKGCRPSTPNVGVPALTVNWYDTFSFDNATDQNIGFDSRLDLNIGNNKTLIWFQASLIYHAASATPPGFGITDFRHEPPRRFAVSGTGIQEGAVLRIWLPNANDFGVSAPTSTPNLTTHGRPIDMPIFSTVTSTQAIEWETAVEMEPYHLFALMNGGFASTEVVEARNDPDSIEISAPTLIPSTDYFKPLERNWCYVQVVNDPANPSTTTASGGWQRLTLQ